MRTVQPSASMGFLSLEIIGSSSDTVGIRREGRSADPCDHDVPGHA